MVHRLAITKRGDTDKEEGEPSLVPSLGLVSLLVMSVCVYKRLLTACMYNRRLVSMRILAMQRWKTNDGHPLG